MTASTAATPPPEPSDDGPPFGLPVLAEVPELAGLLQVAVDAERMTARLVEALIVLEDAGVAPAATGVGLEQWLAIVARSTRSDRRMLTTAAAVCRRLPSLRSAFAAGQVSWSQVRAVALKVERSPRHLDERLDDALARAIDGAAGADPDALSNVVSWALTDLQASEETDDDEAAVPDDVFLLQPRLDGSGGRFHGDFGPVGFASLDAVTDPGPVGTATRDRFGDRPDDETLASNRLTAGRARAARLIDLCRRGGPTDDGDGQTGSGHGQAGPVRPPTLIMRAELDTILGDRGLPSQLLTTLAGGVMHVDSTTARRLVDRHGTDLRLVLLDDGNIVGVGTRTRKPPGWLTDATLALHDTCTEPGKCPTAARACDLDHAVPVPAGGPTDIANLAPLCGPANRRKEPDGWRATGRADGTRTWHHPRTGLTTRTIPTTWRPPGGPPDDHRGPPDHRPSGDDRRGPPDHRPSGDDRRGPPADGDHRGPPRPRGPASSAAAGIRPPRPPRAALHRPTRRPALARRSLDAVLTGDDGHRRTARDHPPRVAARRACLRSRTGLSSAVTLAASVLLGACAAPSPLGHALATEGVWCADSDGVLDTVTWDGHDGELTSLDVRTVALAERQVSDDDLIDACARSWRWPTRTTLCETYAAADIVTRMTEELHVTAVHGAPTADRPGFPVVVRGRVDCEDLTVPGTTEDGWLPDRSRRWLGAEALNLARSVEQRLRAAADGACLDLDEARELGIAASAELTGDWPVIESAPGAADPEHAGLCFDVRLHRAGVVEVSYHAVQQPTG